MTLETAEQPKARLSPAQIHELAPQNLPLNPELYEGLSRETLAEAQAKLLQYREEVAASSHAAEGPVEDIGRDESETSVESTLGAQKMEYSNEMEALTRSIDATIQHIGELLK